jgi:DNA segregation ATPase FtsK/SpoIIIE, S-DNA-T family
VVLMGRKRRRVQEAYDALCDAIATATGTADLVVERARRAHLDTLVELWLREAGPVGMHSDERLKPVLSSSGLADVVRRVESGTSGAIVPADALAELDKIVDAVALDGGPDIDRVPDKEHPVVFSAGEVDGADVDAVPGLWRVGSGRFGGSEPFEVAVPLLDESHLAVVTTRERHDAGLALVERLLMDVLTAVAPGAAMVHVWDVEQLTGPFPAMQPLTRTGMLTVHDPSGLDVLLEELSDRIRRVHNRVFVDHARSLVELAEKTHRRAEPWTVAVLVGNGQALKEEQRTQLQRVARGGVACGVHLVLVNVPMPIGAAVETVELLPGGLVRTSMTGEHVAVRLPAPPEPAGVTAVCRELADAHAARRASSGTFDRLIYLHDDRDEQPTSAAGLAAPIGFSEGRAVDLMLMDSSPHALVGGPSGSGKTNLLLAMIAAMASKYPPSELNFYLLDFKEGVSFAQLAPGRNRGSWLPHARLVGVNINTDREFGLALLQFLADEMRRRAELAKTYEVSKLEELRELQRSLDGDELSETERMELRGLEDEKLPRIVAVIDEFQSLFTPPDGVAKRAVRLLEDVARRGRSQGIHLVLASQDVSGIDAFWGRPGIFEQFVVRIALPRARRVLDDKNEAALELPRWHAVINHESGLKHGNDIVTVPNASVRGTVDKVQKGLHSRYKDELPPPQLFDGSRAPSTSGLRKRVPTGPAPRVLVGQHIDVQGSPATAALPAVPGRNLGVFGTGARDAAHVLDAAATAFVRDLGPSEVDVVIAALVAESELPAHQLSESIADHQPTVRRIDGCAEMVTELADEVRKRLEGKPDRRPVLLVGYALDAADAVLDRAGTEALRTVVHYGPEVAVHVLGWWRSVPRLKALLLMGASVDDIGTWVALDVQGAELQTLLPGAMLTWSPRPGRGLWFDRAQHSAPEVVIIPVPETS